jgi:hypothetical protein
MKVLLPIAFLMVITPVFLTARATPEAEVFPRDETEHWRVGIMPFDAIDLEPHDEWLARSIPLMFLESLSVLREHHLSDAERRARQARILESAQAAAGRVLDQERRSRDRLLFTDITPETREERRDAALKRVAAAQKELNRLLSLEPRVVSVPLSKPIDFYEQARELLPAGLSRGRSARVHNLDLVVYGSVERLDAEFLVIDVFVYSAAQERVVFRDTDVLLPDQVVGLLDEMVDRMAETLLGRTWASLSITASRRDAAIIVDGRLYGFGAVTADFLEPGQRRVVVVHEDVEMIDTVVLLPAERAELAFDLPEPVEDVLSIRSEPMGADVYVDSVWRGRTPLELPRPTRTATVLLQRENHLDSRFLIGPQSPDSMSRILASDIVGWSEETLATRDRFYRSLGFFVLSLPVPIILNGVYNNLYTFFSVGTPPGLNQSDADRLNMAGSALYWGYWTSVGVSTGLFVNMAVQLVRYIRAAESYHFH